MLAIRSLTATALAALLALGVGAEGARAEAPPAPEADPAIAPKPTPTIPSAPQPAGRPVTKAELLTRGLDALARGDAGAYLALLPTARELVAHCPDEAKRDGLRELRARLEVERAEARARVAECAALFDWAEAKQTEIIGGEAEHEEGCAGIAELEDFLVIYAVGEARFRVKLDEPFTLEGGGYGFAKGPRCRPLE